MTMQIKPTALDGVLILEPKVFSDARGFFFESFNARDFRQATGLEPHFVQDNHSRSVGGVLRGIHYQVVRPQAKLVRISSGRVLDVAVDLRRSSPQFGRSVAVELSSDNHRQMWIPAGFGHAFLVLDEAAEVIYKTTDYWYSQHDRSIRWSDPDLGIDWPLQSEPIVSAKDAAAPLLRDAETFE
jgi:dTDP-4-dehydrorhamnose 3,5-epimerase